MRQLILATNPTFITLESDNPQNEDPRVTRVLNTLSTINALARTKLNQEIKSFRFEEAD